MLSLHFSLDIENIIATAIGTHHGHVCKQTLIDRVLGLGLAPLGPVGDGKIIGALRA